MFLKHKCKQRLTKLTQYLIRSRRLLLAPAPKTVTRMAPKRARREETRERKALAAARLEKQIEKELVNRLKSGNYTEDMLNVNEEIWRKVLDQKARAERGEEEVEEEEEGVEQVEFLSDEEGLLSGEDDFDDWLGNGDEAEDEEESEEDEEEEEEEEEVVVEEVVVEEEEKINGKRKSVVNGNTGRRKIARVEIEYEEEREDVAVREHIAAR
jgi:protein MAK16